MHTRTTAFQSAWSTASRAAASGFRTGRGIGGLRVWRVTSSLAAIFQVPVDFGLGAAAQAPWAAEAVSQTAIAALRTRFTNFNIIPEP